MTELEKQAIFEIMRSDHYGEQMLADEIRRILALRDYVRSHSPAGRTIAHANMMAAANAAAFGYADEEELRDTFNAELELRAWWIAAKGNPAPITATSID